MKMNLWDRAFTLALLTFSLISCSSPICRQWDIREISADDSCFNSFRMTLSPESDACHLEVEIDGTPADIRMYINLFLLTVPPCENDPLRTSVSCLLNNGESFIIYPYILSGGQRLLLPLEVSNYLIQLLLEGETFTFQIGRQKTLVILENFQPSYENLTNQNSKKRLIINKPFRDKEFE
jgi:hypothetical protein